ncbi:glucose-6-phosphate dehydrogenase [Brevibacterium renqingii]|uniref:glucose-6-phosphate dehydrogenase n=1 Tax=Brevibacterium renqingii TaxID=2776916 RepID=UPI001ADF09FA|nr:glucose-6-phosphate dehydrogenase [Brevibacterium renqingii]
MDAMKNLVVLGASGDLASRLLLPGLGSLLTASPDRRISVIGSSQTSDVDFRQIVADAFDSVEASGPAVDYARENSSYVQCDVTDGDALADLLSQIDTPACLYFALPPQITMKALKAMADVDLPEDLLLALEKPIGYDLASAKELNAAVGRLVPEEQTFRVDHFLNLPAVLDFMGLRFANQVVEPLLNRDNVESIEIVFDESLGLEGRAAYYDRAGAFRDMIQSHLLQVMGLVMMDPPSTFDHVELPALTAHVLRSTKLWNDDPATAIVRGRYTAGDIDGRSLPDYTDEDGVDPDNATETFAQVTVEVDTWRWSGVPVTLRSGKGIGHPRQEIAVTFRRPPHSYSRFGGQDALAANVLRISLDDERFGLDVNLGGPSDQRGLTTKTATAEVEEPGLEPYGGVLRGILDGDPTFSVRGDAAEEGWRIVEEILDSFDSESVPLRDYQAGSAGPEAANEALDHHAANTTERKRR